MPATPKFKRLLFCRINITRKRSFVKNIACIHMRARTRSHVQAFVGDAYFFGRLKKKNADICTYIVFLIS